MTGCKFRWLVAAAMLMNSVGLASLASGQGLEPERLPKATVFYLAWHGTPSGDVRKANSLLALWDDPEFAPVRAGMVESMVSGSPNAGKPKNELSREELVELASLLDNEFVVGYLSEPASAKAANTGAKVAARHWQGAFFVYDRTGKEAVLAKLIARARASEKDPAKISTTTIAGMPAVKIERTSGASYWVEDGKYAYSASEPAVIEQIVAWSKHTSAQVGWLSKTAAYQEASSTLQGGVAEFFLHLPSLKDLPSDASPGGMRLGPLLQSLRIDAIHAMAGKVVLDGARTHMQGAILGDASAGTPFDIWSDNSAEPVSLQFVEDGTVSYQSSRVNLLGIFGLVKRALRPAGSPNSPGMADVFEQAAATRLGMSLADALGSFSGEFASVQPNAAFDPGRQVYIIGIRKKPEVMKILRAGLEERLTGERNEGDITFFKVSEGGLQSEKGSAAWKYYHVAVGPDAILVAGKNDALRQTLAARKQTPRPPQAWQAARTQFPANINGVSFVDLQKFDWTALKNRWNTDTSKNMAAGTAKISAPPSALENALKNLDPLVLQRHLHLSASASWKDAQGMHFDGWIE